MKLWKRVLGGGMQGLRDAWRILIQFIAFRPDVLHLNTSAQLRGPWDTAILAMAALGRVRSVYHLPNGPVARNHVAERLGVVGTSRGASTGRPSGGVGPGFAECAEAFTPCGAGVVRLPNAIPLPPVESGHEPPTPPTVLYLGHVIPTKGMRELMAAWRELPHGWRLRLAGQGGVAYQNQLLDIVGPEAMVEFLGTYYRTQRGEKCKLAKYSSCPHTPKDSPMSSWKPWRPARPS